MGENLRNVKSKKIAVMLDKERHLLYDLNAFSELEEVFDTVENALKELERGKMSALRAILWAGLVHEDEKLTPKDVGAMITFENLPEIAEALNKSILSALPENKEEKNV